MTPFHLTAEAAATAAAAAYREGRLGFQRGHPKCLYRYDDGGCCAIGAGLPDDVAARIAGSDIDTGIRTAVDDDIVTTDDPCALENLQTTHDALTLLDKSRDDFIVFLRAVNTHLPASVSPITADEWADCPSEWREVA